MKNSRIRPPQRPKMCPSPLSPYIREEIVSRKGVTFDKVILDPGSILAVTLSTGELLSGLFSEGFREAPTCLFDFMRLTTEETQKLYFII
ncbi:hypothetical protein CDAR_306061 [Caerostris darwini]|uniref:Uncharacterized protein n=1 Tax=Caerostris darwini TaxID=1538125 RepID=A0AAV4QL32_9ARAC|nr:hypothetical protein CDAR_306061 [Caerostris darwini]